MAPTRPATPDFSDFFESLFGRGGPQRRQRQGAGSDPGQSRDHHAKMTIDRQDAYRGARVTVSLRMPVVDAAGHATLQVRQLEVSIPKGVRPGQHLRLAGQCAPGQAGAPAGDLYLEIQILPHPVFRLDGGDIYLDLPVATWEAALGATITAPTPDGSVQLSLPPGSPQGRKLRLKGKGMPGKVPGDLYAVLTIALPPRHPTPTRRPTAHWRAPSPPTTPAPLWRLDTMPENDLVTTEAVIVEEHHWFTLVSLCQASRADPDQVHALVGEGLLQPAGQRPDDWRFGGGALAQTRRALRGWHAISSSASRPWSS